MHVFSDLLLGLLAYLAFKVIEKAVVEPIAVTFGRNLIEQYLEEACELIDTTLEMVGLDFDPEELVREYLNLEGAELTEAQVDQVIEAVFEAWDLRMVAINDKN